MEFDKLDKYALSVIQGKNVKEIKELKKLEREIVDFILSENFSFPVEEKVLISDNTASFVYKDNKTFTHIFQFLSELLELEIPFHLNGCKFGPSEIIVAATDKEHALSKLKENTIQLQNMVRSNIVKKRK